MKHLLLNMLARMVMSTIALFISSYAVIFAQWSMDPFVNKPISTASNDQYSATIASDGSSGAIITWYDFRSGTNYDIYAQRINSAGVVQWTSDGVAISTASNDQYAPTIASDGSGGAIITWQDYRSGTNSDIYAQRINSAGVVQWIANGVAISTAANNQASPTLVSDGSGGAIITWDDFRSGTTSDIYAQRINSAGVVQWIANGVAISTAASHQFIPTIVGDGSGGAIITWYDFRSGTNYDIYAQRINSAGVVQWTSDGVAISTAASYQSIPTIVGDGSGGAIITWHDLRSGTNYDIYAQRINSAGAVQWTPDGVAISTAAYNQAYPTITSDGSSGAIITWHDLRSGTNYDIYAQRINSAGAVQWIANGVAISTAAYDQVGPTLVSDGSGGAIITWHDSRSGTNYDIYAQRVDPVGYLGIANPTLTKVKDVRGDQGGQVSIGWNASAYDVSGKQVVTYYSIWRWIELSAVPAQASFLKPEEMSAKFYGTAYRKLIVNATATNWEWLANMPAVYFPKYSYTAATLSDSIGSGTPFFKFTVLAHTSNQFTFWQSNIDSGYSVDNLPPGAVPSLIAQLRPGPSVSVHWPPDIGDADVGYYEVHRSTSSGFTPTLASLITATADTATVDKAPIAGVTNFYRVVTVDVHGNKSPPSSQAASGMQTTQQLSLAKGWNMVSVPLSVDDYGKTTLFPTSRSSAFNYQGIYVAYSSLTNGPGYWLRFSSAQNVSMAGYQRSRDTVNVTAGWNMIGSISQSIPTSQITSIPAGLTTSQFWKYQGGYVASTIIDPGSGYWVKAKQPGKLVLTSSTASATEALRIIIVADGELPPPDPDGTTSNPQSLTPNQFALEQNYPNPFNPATSIEYRVANSEYVSLKVYDLLGREVATLVDEVKEPGVYTASWDASRFASGLYFYLIRAGDFIETRKLTILK